MKARLSAAKREPSTATPRVDSPVGASGTNTPRETVDQKSTVEGSPDYPAMDVEVTTSTPVLSEVRCN